MAERFASVPDVIERLRGVDYLADTDIAGVVFLADRLEKPVLVEGPAGVGKTELAKAVAAILAAVPKFTYATTALWNGSILESSDVCGFRGFATNQITAGYCIFGDFSQVIIGEWGALELVVDPYTQSKTGIIQVTAFQSVDVGLRYPAAFSVSTSVTAP